MRNFSLVLSAGDLYHFHLTAHMSLRDAVTNCTAERADDVLNLAGAFVRALGRPDEAIGPAGLNPVYGDDGVNITVGLPVVRVPVDHGTAFDIAGQGIAREASLVLSCERAVQLAPGWDAVWQAASHSVTAAV